MRIWLTIAGFLIALFTVSTIVMDKIYSKRLELDEMNLLYKCNECGKLHRKYQEEIQIRLDKNYPSYHRCPHCYKPASLYSGEEYPWMITNPEAPKLRLRDLRKIKKLLHDVEQYRKMDRSIEKFLYYYRILPAKEKSKENQAEMDNRRL